MVKLAETLSVSVDELTVEQLATISSVFDKDVINVWNFENSVEQYNAAGGTSKSSVLEQISIVSKWLKLWKDRDRGKENIF